MATVRLAPVIYEMRASDETMRFDLPNLHDSSELHRRLDGTKLGTGWVPPRFEVISEDDDPPRKALDLACLTNGHPVMSHRASENLARALVNRVELLPMLTPVGRYYIVNVTRLLPALIEGKSEVFRYPSGRMGMVVRYELEPNVLPDEPIFKLTTWPNGAILVSQDFVDAVHATGLTGFRFIRAWPSDQQ